LRIALLGPADLSLLVPHLAVTHPLTQGYSAPIISELALALRVQGHRVDLHTLSPTAADVGVYHGDDLTVTVGPYRRQGRARDWFRQEREALDRSLQRHPADVIHANWTYEFALAALDQDRPTIITVHDWAPAIFRHHPHPYRAVRWAMQHHVLRIAPRLASTSPHIAHRLHKYYRRESPVIPNGVRFASDGVTHPRKVATGLRIGSVNNGFSRFKNVHTLIRAFSLIRERRPDASLRLVGTDFEQGGRAQRFAEGLGLASGIEFAGPCPPDQIPEFMRTIDILVHPSLEEAFGRTLLEAISEGALVVAGRDSGAVPWVLGRGAAGELVDVRDPGAIAAVVLKLAAEAAQWEGKRRKAFDHVSARFSLDSVACSYGNLYQAAASAQ
jgi:L-malate glycosyltransferase